MVQMKTFLVLLMAVAFVVAVEQERTEVMEQLSELLRTAELAKELIQARIEYKRAERNVESSEDKEIYRAKCRRPGTNIWYNCKGGPGRK